MIQKSLSLLIHHHHLSYLGEDGVIWLSSVIGRWVDALADHLGQVGLLLYESQQRLPQQDTPINRSNVRLYSLGARRTLRKRVFRRSPLRQVCKQAGKLADGLLIRGMTPHQSKIWRFTPVDHKAFLLVGRLKSTNKIFPRSLVEVVIFLLRDLRFNELRRIANNGTLMLANSPELVSEIEQTLNVQACFVPTNSIRENEFASLHVRPVSNPVKLLYVGRLDSRKGLRELFEALAILNQPGNCCYLDIVGETREPVYSELVELSKCLGIEDSIHWHGLVPYGSKLLDYYQQADIFVLPSYSEGFPHVIWEAMANSCPVIATSVGGISALIEHEEHVLLIPPKNINAIVNAVKRLLADDMLRVKFVEHAYQHALEFSVDTCARKLVHVLYQEWHGYV